MIKIKNNIISGSIHVFGQIILWSSLVFGWNKEYLLFLGILMLGVLIILLSIKMIDWEV